jgi:hypothetical protein
LSDDAGETLVLDELLVFTNGVVVVAVLGINVFDDEANAQLLVSGV